MPEGRFEKQRRTSREIATGDVMTTKNTAGPLMEEDEDLQVDPADPAGRTKRELDELEQEHFKSQHLPDKPVPQEIPGAKDDEEHSFSKAFKQPEEEEKKPPYELTEDGAIVKMMDGSEIEFGFKVLSNGEALEAEVERRKLLGGALFPPVIGQDRSWAEDPMNQIALMLAILKRCITSPRDFLSGQMEGNDPDYLDNLTPVYLAYSAFRSRELENARKKLKKNGSKFAS